MLVDAQGGELRAKYGDGLIRVYSEKLTSELGKGYNTSSLKRMRQFYVMIEKGAALRHQLTWTHYKELLFIQDLNKVNYYIDIAIKQNLSYRELHKKIKSNEYERLDDNTKNKLIEQKEMEVSDFIKNPIIIRNNSKEIITEKMLKQYILEDLDNFLKELGDGFSYIENEYKIRIGNNYNYIDLLLFNIEYNCYVVIELKVTELRKEHIGQIESYMNYINKNVKKLEQNNTIGIIICKKDNKWVMEYCSDERVFRTTYELSVV